MGTHRMLVLLLVCALLGGVSAATVASAEAALPPKKGARYAGRTSQGIRLKIRIDRSTRRVVSEIETRIRTRCTKLGTWPAFPFKGDLRIRGGGRFSATGTDTNSLLFPFEPVFVDGRRRGLFDVTKSRLTGRFVTPRRARGTWHVKSAAYEQRTFPEEDRPVDKCDSGVIRWKARLRAG
jgi:hypothetical protein